MSERAALPEVPEPMPAAERERSLVLALVSHTNVGKTTLARTLLQADVGEVLDQAHVTETSERHVLFETPEGERLVLWDTPGFGDTVRLLKRLRREASPVGWFLNQVWDRFADRPAWCGQQAVRTVQQDTDVVLYLVNASEDPEDAGYVAVEMGILAWIGKPVVVVLNQTGPPRPAAEELADVERWRAALRDVPVVREVLSLDAYTRCWVQEMQLLEHLRAHVPAERRVLAGRLVKPWRRRHLEVFDGSLAVLAAHLERTATDREPLPAVRGLKKADRREAMDALTRRLNDSTRETMQRLIELHGLEGAALAELKTELEDFRLPDEDVDPVQAGLLGGVLGGAVTGLAADVLSGGLTLGGGMLAGSILGALGSLGLARGFRYVKGDRAAEISWSPELLTRLTHEALLRYLAVAHYGRGRGEWRELERPRFWIEAVAKALAARERRLAAAWGSAVTEPAAAGAPARKLEPLLAEAIEEVLVGFYPEVDPFV